MAAMSEAAAVWGGRSDMDALRAAFSQPFPPSAPTQIRRGVAKDEAIDTKSWLEGQTSLAHKGSGASFGPLGSAATVTSTNSAILPTTESTYKYHFVQRRNKIEGNMDGSNDSASIQVADSISKEDHNMQLIDLNEGGDIVHKNEENDLIHRQPTYSTIQNFEYVRMMNRRLEQSNEELKLQIQDLQTSLHQVTARTAQSHKKSELDHLHQVRQTMAKNPFVYVLIDGNHYQFLPYYFQNGHEGGFQATKELTQEMRHFLSQGLDPEYAIICQIFVSFQKLSFESGINLSRIREFAQGFSDNGFAMVDTKNPHSSIAMLFEVFSNNVQCKRVFLGCGDYTNQEYTEILKAATQNPCLADSLALVETYLANSHPILNTMKMTSLFQYGDTFRGNATENIVPECNSRSNSTQKNSVFGHQNSSSFTSEIPRHSWDSMSSKVVRLNVNKERIDPALPDVSSEVENQMMKLNRTQQFCRFYHLHGACSNEACQYQHGDRLTEMQKMKLRHWCRRSRCRSGLSCRKPNCFYGHNCPNLPACQHRTCVFESTHGMDTTVVEIIDS